MRPRASLLAVALVGAPTVACSQPTDQQFRRYVATRVKNDCLKARDQAPNEAFRAHLERLCDCGRKKILATPMSPGQQGSDDSVNRNIQAASSACLAELGGGPGE